MRFSRQKHLVVLVLLAALLSLCALRFAQPVYADPANGEALSEETVYDLSAAASAPALVEGSQDEASQPEDEAIVQDSSEELAQVADPSPVEPGDDSEPSAEEPATQEATEQATPVVPDTPENEAPDTPTTVTDEPQAAGQEEAQPETEELFDGASSEDAAAVPAGDKDDEALSEDLTAEEEVSEELALAAGDADTEKSEDAEASKESAKTPSVTYQAHVQNDGWQKWVKDGATAGTSGRALRVEGFKIKLENAKGSIEYRAHVQNVGWQDWVKDGALAGTSGKALRVEGLQLRLTGEIAKTHDIWIRSHVQNIGWTAWAKGVTGTVGMGYRQEAIELCLVEKGGAAPATGGAKGIYATAHVQNVGWQSWRTNKVGTQGKSYRVEALKFQLVGMPGGIEYRTHVQNVGWQGYKKNAALSGTEGRALRVEAINLRLTGEAANLYDIYYRVHVQDFGWLGWAKNDETAGTEGMAKRVEAIEYRLVAKGGKAPSNDGASYATPSLQKPSIQYRTDVQSKNWLKWVSNGATSGTSGQSLRIEQLEVKLTESGIPGNVEYRSFVGGSGWTAWTKNGASCGADGKRVEGVQIKLTGDISKYFDVWYRTHIQNLGWTGWSKNGQSSGSESYDLRAEAVQIRLLPKGSAAPGTTNRRFINGHPSGNDRLDSIVRNIIKNNTGVGSDALYNAYIYVSQFRYIKMDELPGNDWDWSIQYAIEMWDQRGGNCYRYAALTKWLAVALGYNADAYAGRCPSISRGMAPHGWTRVFLDGVTYVIDSDLRNNYPTRDWFMKTYDNALIQYAREDYTLL